MGVEEAEDTVKCTVVLFASIRCYSESEMGYRVEEVWWWDRGGGVRGGSSTDCGYCSVNISGRGVGGGAAWGGGEQGEGVKRSVRFEVLAVRTSEGC